MTIDPDGQWVHLVVGAVIGGVSSYIAGRQAGLRGRALAGFVAGGAIIGAISGGIGSSVSAGVGAAVAGASGGLIGAAAGGAAAGAINGFYSTALANSYGISSANPFESALKGGIAGIVGGGLGGYIGGPIGAIAGGASGSFTGAALNGAKGGDLIRAAAIGGLVSYGVYETSTLVSYLSSQSKNYYKYRKLSIMAERSFGRGREWGAWETEDRIILDPKMGTKFSTNPGPMPENAIARWHTHPNSGKGWVETFSDFIDPITGNASGDLHGIRVMGLTAKYTGDLTYPKLNHYVVGRNMTFQTSTWAAMNYFAPYQMTSNLFNRYPFFHIY